MSTLLVDVDCGTKGCGGCHHYILGIDGGEDNSVCGLYADGVAFNKRCESCLLAERRANALIRIARAAKAIKADIGSGGLFQPCASCLMELDAALAEHKAAEEVTP
jgi:hypothetical protein